MGAWLQPPLLGARPGSEGNGGGSFQPPAFRLSGLLLPSLHPHKQRHTHICLTTRTWHFHGQGRQQARRTVRKSAAQVSHVTPQAHLRRTGLLAGTPRPASASRTHPDDEAVAQRQLGLRKRLRLFHGRAAVDYAGDTDTSLLPALRQEPASTTCWPAGKARLPGPAPASLTHEAWRRGRRRRNPFLAAAPAPPCSALLPFAVRALRGLALVAQPAPEPCPLPPFPSHPLPSTSFSHPSFPLRHTSPFLTE